MSRGAIDLSIVVASYETCDRTLACLAAIERSRIPEAGLAIETLVVENGSRDGSPEAIERAYPEVRLFALVRNRGFASAINLGLRAARGRHVLLLNSDVLIDPELLARGVAWLDEKSEIGVLGFALRHPDGRAQRSVHPLPDLQTELLPGALLRLLRPRGYPPRTGSRPPESDRAPIDVEAVRGAVFFVRSELLEKVGFLDESYFFFLEETDYCRRTREAGHRVCYCPDALATHALGASSKSRAPLATRIEYHRSLYRYLERQRGKGVARVARGVRGLRTAISVVGLALGAPFATRARARLAERGQLLLWHLRGCPPEPRFVEALAADSKGSMGERA